MKQIKKPKYQKSLTKVREQWFQEGNAFRRIIDYNKITGGSMWTKEQQADLDARELKLNHKIDDVESRLNHKIDDVESRLNHKIDKVEARLKKEVQEVKEEVQELKIKMNVLQNSVDRILNILEK